MLQGAAQLQAKLTRLVVGFDGIAEQVAAESVGDVARAVRGDIGDTSMSGWRRGNPVEIVGAVEHPNAGIAIVPKGQAKGPMRVLESGRNAYAAGDRRNSGTYTSKKTGITRQKTRKVKRSVTAHGGKGTWSDAKALIEANLAKRSQAALHRVMARIFTKG